MSQYHQVASALMDIEAALRQLHLWQSEPAPAEALRSEQPFAVDTLQFEQWLQFIFLPKIRFLVDQEQPLPGQCSIAPMAEESFRGRQLAVTELLAALENIDALLSQ
jgi:uncharacterized protein YqcC (DUF446 family)